MPTENIREELEKRIDELVLLYFEARDPAVKKELEEATRCLTDLALESWRVQYTSNELFHFVGWKHPTDSKKNYEVLSKVLTDKCISHPPHWRGGGEIRIVVIWGANILKGELIVPTVTCYADIPRGSLQIHTKKYGQFGLSIARTVLASRGARPVTYMPYHPNDNVQTTMCGFSLIKRLHDAAEAFQEFVVKKLDSRPKSSQGYAPSTPEHAITEIDTVMIKDILAFVKPFDFTRDVDDPLNYYMEREWRKYGNLEFQPEWVSSIVVPSDYVERTKKDFPQYVGRISACPI
jgi:hypothetical protein